MKDSALIAVAADIIDSAQNFDFMFQYQPLSDIEQVLELSKVGVPANFQTFIVIWSKMNREASIVVDINNHQVNTLVFKWRTGAFSARFACCGIPTLSFRFD